MDFGKRFSFGKNEKLKGKVTFEALFSEGKSISAFPLKLIYLKTDVPQDTPFKVGVVAPKKKFKSAVKRNRIKRLLRESYRLNKHLLFNNVEGNFAFLFLYLGNKMPNAEEVNKAVVMLMSTFLKKQSNEKTNT
ncbi:ribonuclease P protein component [Flagellimonas flava]|uniref:Ribonuclease P protein component n=1 Tax=Flagellimonas flava TaxID=570519 RepID=A0A1M5KXL9_9FLAO|nr:ribonuclease P protein component [Allomuricauda flava]SHG57497.1 ribonuclease P protein component [Allomuricauda flava]